MTDTPPTSTDPRAADAPAALTNAPASKPVDEPTDAEPRTPPDNPPAAPPPPPDTPPAAPAEPAWMADARAAGWQGPPPPEPEWMRQARESGWNPPDQPAAPTPAAAATGSATAPVGAAVAGAGAPGGTPTGTTAHAGTPAAGLVPTGVPPNAQPGVDAEGFYAVQPGESLPLIAERFGHPGEWRELHFANYRDVYDPAQLAPGQRLKLPPEWLNAPEEPAGAESSTQRST